MTWIPMNHFDFDTSMQMHAHSKEKLIITRQIILEFYNAVADTNFVRHARANDR